MTTEPHNSSIIPATSLRDILSLILILNFFPKYINTIVMILYILSGSTKFIGGKLFMKYFELNNSDDSFVEWNNEIDYQRIIKSAGKTFTYSMFLLLMIKTIWSSVVCDMIDLFAKTIISVELIGSSRNYTTFITNNQSPNNTLPPPATTNHQPSHPHVHTRSSLASANNNANNNVTTAVNPNTNAQVSFKSDSLLLDNPYINVIYYFLMVCGIYAIPKVLKLELVRSYIDLYDLDLDRHLDLLFFRGGYQVKKPGFLDQLTSMGQLKHKELMDVFLFIYYLLCIYVIMIKFSPIFSILGLKKVSNNLDLLNSLSSNIPIDFKRAKFNFKDETISKVNSVSDNTQLPVISLKSNDVVKKLADVSVPKSVSGSRINVQRNSSIAGKNFETFVLKSFTNHRSQQVTTASSNPKINKNSNSTLIIDRNLSIVQPFWSLLAVFKALTKDSTLFQGKSSTLKNNKDQYFLNFNKCNKLVFAAAYIDDTTVLFKCVPEELRFPLDLKIKVNGIDWEYVKITEDELLIYALSRLAQYEIEILDSTGELLGKSLINTISTVDDSIMKESTSISPIATLKASLLSTIGSLNKIRLQLRDFKKEETKKQGEVKRTNDILLEKILKSSNAEEQNLKKIKVLKQSIKQFEIDILNLEEEIKKLLTNEVEKSNTNECSYSTDIKQISKFISDYEETVEGLKAEFKQKEDLETFIISKAEKNKSKYIDISREIDSQLEHIESFKTFVCQKLQKRCNKINEGFDAILPRIRADTLNLDEALEALKQEQRGLLD